MTSATSRAYRYQWGGTCCDTYVVPPKNDYSSNHFLELLFVPVKKIGVSITGVAFGKR